MGLAEFVLCVCAVWGLFKFADGLVTIGEAIDALAKAIADE